MLSVAKKAVGMDVMTSRYKVLLISAALGGFVLGASLVLVMARHASAGFAEAMLAQLDGSGYRAALAKWQRADYQGAACQLSVLEEQLSARPELRTSEIWSLEFPFASGMLASLYAPKPQLERSQADIYRLLQLRAEERSGLVVDPERYRSVADRMRLRIDVEALRKMADHLGDSPARP